MNPNGLVPTLIDGSAPPLFETGAIPLSCRPICTRELLAIRSCCARTDRQMGRMGKNQHRSEIYRTCFWLVVRTAPSRVNPETIATNLKPGKYLRIADDRLDVHQYLDLIFTFADIQMGIVSIDITTLPSSARDHPICAAIMTFCPHAPPIAKCEGGL